MGVSLGGKGGGCISSSSRVGGNRVLPDEPELSVLLLMEDCLVQVPSADTVLCVLDRGEGTAADCDRIEATEDVRESAIDERRRVRGDGESSSSLSLHPNPVVRPIPPRKSLPSLCRLRRLTVSRPSLNRPVFVFADVVDMTLPCRADVSSAAITLERGEISPSLNITCANGVCKSRLESDSVPPPSNSLSSLSISISSSSASESPSCLPSGKLNFLVTDGLLDDVCPTMAEGALDLCGCLFNKGARVLDCSLDDGLDNREDFLRRGLGVSEMMVWMSGLVRPLGKSPSLFGKGCEGSEVVTGGGDLNEEGGGDDFFDFLTGCDVGDCGGFGN